ncbi:uncharacterized protein M6B38_164885 [Iris pallida]|uniref:Zinc knuckle CX2CX4HX4C domain-containing protein n=1 Tax=Iris pallida TaxID=29817 RepID=A0AAX6EY74_IRIPA|nr:uncharacterized protein M6B38_164885 [Iris pallida]
MPDDAFEGSLDHRQMPDENILTDARSSCCLESPKATLFNIVECFGTPLAVGRASALGLHPNREIVFVEVDTSKPHHSKVRIVLPKGRSYWQPIVYERTLLYCLVCRHRGHLEVACKFSQKEGERGNWQDIPPSSTSEKLAEDRRRKGKGLMFEKSKERRLTKKALVL